MHIQVKRDIRVTVQWHARNMLIRTCEARLCTRLYAYIHFKDVVVKLYDKKNDYTLMMRNIYILPKI